MSYLLRGPDEVVWYKTSQFPTRRHVLNLQSVHAILSPPENRGLSPFCGLCHDVCGSDEVAFLPGVDYGVAAISPDKPNEST